MVISSRSMSISILCLIILGKVHAQPVEVEPSSPSSSTQQLFMQNLLFKQQDQIANLSRQVQTLNETLRPSALKRMGRLGMAGLACYGAYALYNDYQQSSYKPVVDHKIQQYFKLYERLKQPTPPQS